MPSKTVITFSNTPDFEWFVERAGWRHPLDAIKLDAAKCVVTLTGDVDPILLNQARRVHAEIVE